VLKGGTQTPTKIKENKLGLSCAKLKLSKKL